MPGSVLVLVGDLELDETDVAMLRLMRIGLSDAAIARRLELGHRTVQRRAQQLMVKLYAPNRFALGARAQELGLLAAVARELTQSATSVKENL